LYLIEVVS